MAMQNKYFERIGKTGLNSYGSEMIVDEYVNGDDIWVRFVETGNRVHTSWKHFCKGNVRNVYDRSVFKIGYLGEGKYKSVENGKVSIQYQTWLSIFKRCYSESFQKRQPAYVGCSIAEEWHNFQNFAKWFDENYYEVKGERIELDKDILCKDNKNYSPDTCIFVPKSINTLFIKCDASRGNHPVGVTFHKRDRKYYASCNNGRRKSIHLGRYDSPEEAFQVYRIYKEKIIKQIANEYKEQIPLKLYIAMINYKVEIND